MSAITQASAQVAKTVAVSTGKVSNAKSMMVWRPHGNKYVSFDASERAIARWAMHARRIFAARWGDDETARAWGDDASGVEARLGAEEYSSSRAPSRRGVVASRARVSDIPTRPRREGTLSNRTGASAEAVKLGFLT